MPRFERADTAWNCYLFGALPKAVAYPAPAAPVAASLREALEPIAKAADNYADCADEKYIDDDATVSVADLRNIRAALAEPVPVSVRDALEAINAAHTAMFAQCCSNPITNAWGKEVDVSALNEAHRLAEIALASLPAPAAAPTIDDVPSCGQENDYRRAKPAAAPPREEIISIVEEECFLNHFSPLERTKSQKTLCRVGHNIRERILALKVAE